MTDPLQDDISSVELITYMGNDLMVVNAARVSMNKIHEEFIDPAATKLINYLAAHQHWTPFAHPQLQFRIKMPIFVAREWYRHTVGFARNEVSRRYVDFEPELYIPEYNTWRKRQTNLKQGSSSEIVEETPVLEFYGRRRQLDMLLAYARLLNDGVAPEMARMVLPQSMYTEFIETASLYAYARLCHLRISPDAQQEICRYAEAVSDIIEELFPVSWQALTKNNKESE